MDQQKQAIYEFGEFRLDALRLSLTTADGQTVPLKPKACEILLALIEFRGQVATKEELLRRVWGGTIVEEGNLTVNLSSLRKALGDSADRPRFIVTLPGKGYRFVADVREVRESAEPQPVSTSVPPSTLDVKPVSGRRWIWIAAVAGLLVLTGAAAWLIYRSRRTGPPPFANLRLTRLTTTGNARSAAISPDGRFVAYVVEENQAQSIWLKQLNAASDRSIVGPLNDSHLAGLVFSRSGEEIYFLRSDQGSPSALMVTGLLGGKMERLAEDVDSPPAVSPDGRSVAFIRGIPTGDQTTLFVLPARGGEARAVATRPSAAGFVISANPAWSEDGKTITCATKEKDQASSYFGLVQVDVASGKAVALPAPRFTRIDQLAVLHQGRGVILAGATDATAALNQIWHLAPDGAARRITNDLYDYREISVTADGTTITAVKRDVQTNIWSAPDLSDAGSAQLTTSNYDGAEGMAFTPGGDLIYTARGTENLDLWRRAADGSKHQLTVNAGNNTQPAVSPDGRTIAFTSTRSGTQHIWVMNADGGAARQLTNGLDDGAPDWTVDGQAIIYRSYVNGIPLLFRIPAAGGTPAQITEKMSGPPRVSGDGTKLLVQIRPSDLASPKLSIIDIKGGPAETEFGITSARYQWTADGRAFVFVNGLQDNAMNLRRQSVDPAVAPEQLTHWASERIYAFALTRDGKTAAVARGRNVSDVVLITQTDK